MFYRPGAVLQTPLSFISRPGVAGAVLQIPLSLINSVSQLVIHPLWKYLLKGATALKVEIFTRALLPQKFIPKGVELVGGGSVINGA